MKAYLFTHAWVVSRGSTKYLKKIIGGSNV